jgi:hypothetical protein
MNLSLLRKEGAYIRLWLAKGNKEAKVDPDTIQNIIVHGNRLSGYKR